MKKKKHPKKSISRKLRDESNIFFSRYENNVTRSSFIRNYAKFIDYCRKEHNCKTKEECKEQIFNYIDYLKEIRIYSKYCSYIPCSRGFVSRSITRRNESAKKTQCR